MGRIVTYLEKRQVALEITKPFDDFIGNRWVCRGGVPHLVLEAKIMEVGWWNDKSQLSNFGFVPQIFGRAILHPMSKIASPNGSCALDWDAVGIAVADQCRHLLICFAMCPWWAPAATFAWFCILIVLLYPLPTFSSPWRNSFVQFHGRTALLKAKFGNTPQKWPKNNLNWRVRSSYGTNKPLLRNHRFPLRLMIQSYVPERNIMTLTSNSTCISNLNH